MKGNFGAKMTLLCLSLLLVLVMAPTAVAANVSNQQNNFDYEYGAAVLVDAGEEGAAFTKTFARPAEAKAGALYAAVEPVDAGGKSLGLGLRYVRLTDSGELTYFRTGCRYFNVQLVQPLPSAGDGSMVLEKDGEKLSCRATLSVSKEMAALVDLYQSREEMAGIGFTCHVRYSSPLSLDIVSMELESDVFQVVKTGLSSDGYGYDIQCRLKDGWRSVAVGQNLVQKLMREMRFTAQATLSAADQAALEAAGVTKLYATGWLTVSNIPTAALGGSVMQVPMATSVLELQKAENPYTDVAESDWYYDEVMYAYEHKLMDGVAPGKFAPKGDSTRAMIWTILARMDGEIIDGKGEKWYSKAQAWAVENGVSDGADPNGKITREQLATMLYRYAGSPAVSGDLAAFPDAAKVSSWARDGMLWAVEKGIIGGSDGKLDPRGSAIRAQVATILMRFAQLPR